MESESILVPSVEPRLPSFLPTPPEDRSIVFSLDSPPETIQRQLAQALAQPDLEPELVSYLSSYNQQRVEQQKLLVKKLQARLLSGPAIMLKILNQAEEEGEVVILEKHMFKSQN